MTAPLLAALFLLLAGRRDELLRLDVRRRIYQWVHEYPGLHLREIARDLGLQPNHAKYHLLYLQRNGIVSSRREGGYLRFFALEGGPLGPRESVSPSDKAILAFLRRPVPLHIVLALLDAGPLGLSALASAVGVARPTLHYHLGMLQRAGVVEVRQRGRDRVCHLVGPESLVSQLVRYRPPDALVRGFLEAWEALELP